MNRDRAWLVPALAATGVLLHHAAWFSVFPQYGTYPPDQAGYVAGGRVLGDLLHRLSREGPTTGVTTELRRWFDFLGVSLLYGAIDALRPNNLTFMRWTFATFNALTAGICTHLALRISGVRAAWVTAALFLISPAFPSGASRLYPDAVTGFLVAFGVMLFIRSERAALVGGGLVGAAMLIRVQLLPWVPIALGLLTLIWLTSGQGRQERPRVSRAWLGLSASLMVFGLLSWFGLENRNDSIPKHNLPRYHYYAYGFWQYLTSDGWDGPFRLKEDPFYLDLVKASEGDPALLKSRARQYVFAFEYVARRLDRSVPIALGNLYRMFARPQNPEHRGFIPPEAAVWIHRSSIVAALVGILWLWARGSPAIAMAALILALGGLHALAYSWPRYAMPVLPLVISLAGIGTSAILGALHATWRRWLVYGVAAAALMGLARMMGRAWPEAGHAAFLVSVVASLTAALFIGTADWPIRPSKFARGSITVVLGLTVFANAWRDANWHETSIPLEAGDVVIQRIRTGAGTFANPTRASERYVGVDLERASPGQTAWRARLNGRDIALRPSIPPLPESIPIEAEGTAYPQWWIAPLLDIDLERAATVGGFEIELWIDDPSIARLKADRFREQSTVFEAPGLGDWPFAAGLKPEYDRDFRLVRRLPVSSLSAVTLLRRRGEEVEVRDVARIRVFELDDRSGRVSFEVAPTGVRSGRLGKGTEILAFSARAAMKDRGEALLRVAGVDVMPFTFAHFRDRSWENGGFRLCYRDHTPNRREAYDARGVYLLSGPLGCAGSSCPVEVQFWPGMDDRPMSFGPDLLKNQPDRTELAAASRECGFSDDPGWVFTRLVDGTKNAYPTDTGRWRVARIY